MKWMKFAFAVVAIVAALGGVVWAADLGGGKSTKAQAQAQTATTALSVEQLIADKSGLSLDTIHKFEAAGLSAAADKGTSAGVLSSTQASALRSVVPGPILDRVLQATAKAANTSDTNLVSGIEGGQSLAQIAAANGVSRDALKANLTAALASELAIDKTAGLVTDQQIAMINVGFATQLDKLIDRTMHS
jgi:hypothetical protein